MQPFTPKLVDGGKAGAGDVSAIPPEDLPAAQRDFWHRYAPSAIEKRTLTLHTVAAFRLLCEVDAKRHQIWEQIERDGLTYLKVFVDSSGQEHQELKKHPLMTEHRQYAQRVDALLARFMLAPFGKPVEPQQKKTAANPWATVVSR